MVLLGSRHHSFATDAVVKLFRDSVCQIWTGEDVAAILFSSLSVYVIVGTPYWPSLHAGTGIVLSLYYHYCVPHMK